MRFVGLAVAEKQEKTVLQPEELPLVTFALFAYNQEKYIREAVEGAFAQTYEPLEIILSDDYSNDKTYELMQELAAEFRGPHKVVVRRNERNLGLTGHICSVVSESQGELIFAAAGDDYSYPDRVASVVRVWQEQGRPSGSLFSRFKTIDEEGIIKSNAKSLGLLRFSLADRPKDILDSISVGTLGCTQAWTRDIFQLFGELDPRIIHEDIAIPLRSLMVGSVIFMPDELVLYRLTNSSLSRINFNDYKDRMRKMARYWAGRVANYDQLSTDISTAVKLKRISLADAEWIYAETNATTTLARGNAKFFDGNTLDRIQVVFTSLSHVPIRQTLKWLIIIFAPYAYGFRLRK